MDGYIRRNVTQLFTDALSDTPVVIVQGPRQCGKSTLVKQVCPMPYVTLDEPAMLEAAVQTPASFLNAYPEGVVIDEIQRAPKLALAAKAAIDKDRRPSRFVFTGSTDVLALPKLADSLAGRMEVIDLLPLSNGEKIGINDDFAVWAFGDSPPPPTVTDDSTVDRLAEGGFPDPVSRKTPARKRAWFDSYIKALVERDLRDLADLGNLALIPRLLRMLAVRPYAVMNISQLSRDVGLPHTTLTRYLSLLERVFLVREVPAWTETQGGKAAKTSRLAFVDPGVMASLAPASDPRHSLENMVAAELFKQATWTDQPFSIRHFRSLRHTSVPIVLEASDGRLVGVVPVDRPEIEEGDFDGLRFLSDVAGKTFWRGIVLTTGGSSKVVSDRLCALPLSALSMPSP